MVKSKDAAKPKNKMSAYQFFMVELKEEKKAKNPGEPLKLADLSKDVSEKWKNLSNKDRKKYEDLASKDLKRYNAEMANYVPKEQPKKRKRDQKDPNAPKRALSSFFYFCNDERSKVKAENPGASVGEIAKLLGKRWETCKNKSKYEELAKKDKERYAKEKESYTPGENAKVEKSKTKSKSKKKQKLETEDTEERENEDDEEEEENESD